MARHPLLVVILMFLPVVLNAQYVDLSDKEQMLYTGKANVLKIPDLDRVFVVKAKYGWVQALEPRTYVIYEPYRRPPAADTITVRSKSGVLLKQKVFKVENTGGARVQLGTLTSDTITYAQLLEADSIVVVGGKAKHKVTSFEVSYQFRRNDYQGPFAINSNKIGPFVRTMLLGAQPGTFLYIGNVKTDCGGCKEFIHPMSLNQKIVVK
jgi:hypothetical protein